jgi:hypothetical protein
MIEVFITMSDVFEIPELVSIYIVPTLLDRDRLRLLSVTKRIRNRLLGTIYFDEQYTVIHKKTETEWYYHYLRNVKTCLETFPKHIQKLELIDSDTCNYMYLSGEDAQCCGPKASANSGLMKIPDTVTHLTFPNSFDRDFDEIIPSSLIELTFGHNFNRPIKKPIPKSVIKLTFGAQFNQTIRGVIPDGITHLTLGRDFAHCIKDAIPPSVQFLTYSSRSYLLRSDAIPRTVTHLVYDAMWFFDPETIPQTVVDLTIDGYRILSGRIPISVTHLTFGPTFNCAIPSTLIPPSVTHMTLGDNFDQFIEKEVFRNKKVDISLHG